MGKLADELLVKRDRAHRDVRPEISLLGLFSYDKLSTVAREKGWILPPDSYLSKLVCLSVTEFLLSTVSLCLRSWCAVRGAEIDRVLV